MEEEVEDIFGLKFSIVISDLELSTCDKMSFIIKDILFVVQSNLAITRVEGGRILRQKTAL